MDDPGEWVASRLGIVAFDKHEGFLVRRGGVPVAGIIYTRVQSHMCEMTIASDHPSWCSRAVLRLAFGYPFNQLGVKRVQAVTAKGNKAARRMLERLGFTTEGLVRFGYSENQHAVLYSMLRDECKWV